MQYLGSFQNWNSTERYPLHEIIWREDYSILETAFSSSLILIIGREDSNNVFGSKVWKEICTSVEMYFNARYAYWISNLEIASLNQNLPQAFETASATTNYKQKLLILKHILNQQMWIFKSPFLPKVVKFDIRQIVWKVHSAPNIIKRA